MATRAGDITFGVGFQVDKTGLQQVQQSLQQIQNMSREEFMELNPTINTAQAEQQLKALKKTAQEVGIALNNSFNAKLGTINLSTFNKQLQDSSKTVHQLYTQFNQAGEIGKAAFREMTAQSLTANIQLKQSNKLLVDMGKTLANSFKYTLSYGTLNLLSSSIRNALQYSIALDSSLNDIRIVTDKSADDMERFAQSANKAAKELGQSTIDYTKASLIYYQQGLSDEDVQARTDVTLKAANVTGQSTQEVSEQLTAVWNGYKVSAAEAELYVDKLAAVAATTASDLEELSTGMSKVASAANAMGVDVDQLNGMLSTIVSVTRQAPESAGTALKTIFARMGDLKIDGEDEFGVSLGEVSGQLAEVGVNIMNATGELRDMGEVIEEVGNKWNTGAWSEAEKQAIAIELAGKRQYNNLLALFENWDMYNKAVETSMASQGTLQKQQDIYMESTAAHLQKMKAALEGVKDSLLNPNDINPILDNLTSGIELLEKAIDMVGGLKGAFIGLAPIIVKAMGPSIAQGIDGLFNNKAIEAQNRALYQSQMTSIYNLKNISGFENDKELQALVNAAERLYSSYKALEPEEQKQLQNLVLMQQKATETARSYDLMADAVAKNLSKYTGMSFTRQSIQAGAGKADLDDLAQAGSMVTRLQALSGSVEKNEIKFQRLNKIITEFKEKLPAAMDGAKKSSQDFTKALNNLEMAAIDDPFDNYAKDIEIVERELRKMAQTSKQGLSAMSEEAHKARQEMKDLGEATEQALSSAERRFNIDSIVQGLSGITQVGFAISTISSGLKVLGDDTASLEDKISSIFMGATLGVPQLLSGIKAIEKSLTSVSTAWSLLRAQKIKNNTQDAINLALIQTGNKAHQATLKVIAKRIMMENSDTASLNANTITIQANNLAKQKGLDLTGKDLKAIKQIITGRKAVTTATQASTAAQTGLNSAILAFPGTWLLVVLGGLITSLTVFTKITKEANEAISNTLLEENESIKKNVEHQASLKELSDEYEQLLNKYKQTGEGQTDLQKTALDLCKQYDLESAKILALTGQYEELNRIVQNSLTSSDRLEEANRLILNANGAGQAIMANNLNWDDLFAKSVFEGITGTDLADKTVLHAGFNIFGHDKKAIKLLEDNFDTNARDFFEKMLHQISFESDNVLDAYNQLGEMMRLLADNHLADSDVYDNIKKQYESLAQAAEDYKVGIDLQNEILIQQTAQKTGLFEQFNADLEYSKDKYIEFTNAIEIFRKSLEQSFTDSNIERSAEEIDKMVAEYINSLDSSYAARYQTIESLQKTRGYHGAIQIDNTDQNNFDALMNLSDKEFSYIISLGFTGKEDEQWIKRSIALLDQQENPTITIDYVEGLINGVTDNKLTKTEAREYSKNLAGATEENPAIFSGYDYRGQGDQIAIAQQALNEATQQRVDLLEQQMNIEENQARITQEQTNQEIALKDATKERDRILSEITFTYQKEGSVIELQYNALQMQTELGQLRNQLAKNYSKELKEEIDAKQEAYDLAIKENEALQAAENTLAIAQAKAQELTAELENAANVDFGNIRTEFFDLVDQSIDATISKVDNLTTATQLIGEGFQVAADDVDKLANAYPELFDGASMAAEDMMQLNEETVKAFVKGKEEEVNAEIDAQVKKIKCEQDILKAQQESNNAKIEILDNYLQGKISVTEAESQLTEEEAKFEDKTKKILSDHEVEIDKNSLLNQSKTIKAEIQNLEALFKAYQSVGSAAEAALVGESYKGSFQSGSLSTSAGLTYAEHQQSLEELNKEVRENEEELFEKAKAAKEQLIQENTLLAARLSADDKAIAQLEARRSEATGTLGRVGEGKAGKKSKSSSSSKESEDKKQLLKLEDEIDLYREVNEQLEEVDHNLKMLQKQEDRTYGTQHIENLKAQSAELAKQQKLIEKKLGLTKQDLAMRQKLLSAQGVQFGVDGDISNYQALLTEKINNINALYTQYNNTLDKALKSTIKTQADNAKEEYESLKKSIEAYEKLQDQMDQLNEQWQDARNAEIDKQIEAFNYRIDIDLNMAKATKRWNEFKRKVVDDMENIADPVKKVIEQMKAGIEDYRATYSAGGEVAINTGAVRETLDQFNQMMATGTASIYGNNPAQLVADLEKRKEDLMKSVEDAEQIIADMRKMYLDSLDDAYDKMEKHTEQYEYISNLIEHDINLIELLRGEEAYEDMGRYYDRQAQNNIKNVEFLKMQRDALREQVDSLEKDSKAWKKVYQQLQDTEMELRDSVNESVQLLLDRYENGLNKILKDLDKKVSGGMGVDYLQEQYEMQQDLADNYLDSVNQAYALEKLRAKFTKAINDTTDIKAREKLTNLLHEQVDALAEKEKLAQYEVDHAEKMLEVEQARIALEEAQANKSQMRLKRDNQGNYSYQYVADEDAIDDAQQDLLDAENDLWNFDVEGLRTAREEAIKIWQEYFEKLREIWEDTSLTEEERQQKLLDLDNWRTGELEANVEKYNFFKTNTEQDANTILADLYSQNADEFGRVVMEEILPDWNSGVDSMIEKYAGEGIPACQEALAQLQANTEEYRTKVDELAEAAGMDFEEICNGIDMTIDYTYSLMSTNEEMIDQYRREMDELNELNRILEDVQREFQAARDEAIRMAQEATNAIQKANELRAASEAAKAAADAAAAAANQSSYYNGGGSGSNSGSGSGSKNNSFSSAEKVNGFGPYNGFTDYKLIVEGRTTRTNITEAEAKRMAEDLRKRGVDARAVHMATGGYTGDWHSSEGKMAVLHEKELVLNKHDTENMLDAVNVVRHIVASLDGSMLGRLADMSALAFNSITPGIEASNETLEQNVHIEASFPNANNRNEIEEAFNNLVNIASQKALNTRR